jgi:polygalacturonase
MATIASTVTPMAAFGERKCHLVSWTPLTFTGSDVGAAIEMGASADRSVQVTGTFGAGGSVTIEGSNDGTNYHTLNDPQGNALAVTSAKTEQVMELTRYIRPRITAGDGTTSLTVTMFLRRTE